MDKIGNILKLVIAIAAVAGILATLDGRWAKADITDRVSAIEQRVDRHEIEVRMEKLQERMWAMEDRWGEKFMVEKNRIHDTLEELLHFMTKEARDHYRDLQAEYKKLEKELKEAGSG